jgi:hypothetical protein
MVGDAHATPGPQDYELVDRRFPHRDDSYEELMIRETRALAVMQARLAMQAAASQRASSLSKKL